MPSMKEGGIWHQSWFAVANLLADSPLLASRPKVLQASCGVIFFLAFWEAWSRATIVWRSTSSFWICSQPETWALAGAADKNEATARPTVATTPDAILRRMMFLSSLPAG